MSRTALERGLATLFCSLSIACTQVPAGPASDFPFGEWSGGFGLIHGDKLHWTHLSANLQANGSAVGGEGIYVTGPRQGLTGSPIEISGNTNGEQLDLRLTFGGNRATCEATYDTQSAVGHCKVDGEVVELRLVKVTPAPSDAKAIQGVYRFEDGRRMLIGEMGGIPIMLDLPSGFMRMLYPRGKRTWTAGPQFIVGAPEQWRLDFAEEELVVQRSGEAPRRGVRRPAPVREEFLFNSRRDGITLRGTLTLPAGAGPHPGLVWVHGSGRTPRQEAMFFPEYLADLGIALLTFDKRGVGDSEGTYAMPDGATFNRAFLYRRGEDVASALETLRGHPQIASERVGLFGISQAGWVIPIAASLTHCALTVTMGGGATPLSQEDYYSQLTDELRSDATLMSITTALEKVRSRPVRGHDWSTDFASQRCPGLWLYGMRDRINPSQLAVEVLERVKTEHDKDFTIVEFPDGNHPLMESRLGGRAESLVLSRFVPGMFDTIEEWFAERGFSHRGAAD